MIVCFKLDKEKTVEVKDVSFKSQQRHAMIREQPLESLVKARI